jgi:hypothetical protein
MAKLTAKNLTEKQLKSAATSPAATKQMQDDAKAELNSRKGALAAVADTKREPQD